MGNPIDTSSLQQRLLAILAADAAGYSRLMSMDEGTTVVALEAARTVFRRQVARHGGRIVDTAGDSVLAVFPTAHGAMAASIAVQHELSVANASIAGSLRLLFRIGLHLGDVLERPDGTVYGDGVNVAARLQSIAEPGGIAASETMHAAVKGRSEAHFDDQGEKQVKSYTEPLRVFAVRAADLAVDGRPAALERNATPQPVVAPSLRTNLPAELPALLGRDDDLAALGALIDRYRLVSIVGAGGIGKSVLARRLLDTRRRAYPHGVCWIELAAVTDRAALPGAIMAALGVDGGRGEPLAALLTAVAPLTMLVALDNAEHLLDDVARVCRALHDAAPGLRLVVTSQAPLKVAAERIYRIGPLAVPQGVLPAQQALTFGAVALFTERAQAVDARFALADSNAPAVIEVCRALDGLALAIELAAVRAPMLGVQRLVSGMQDRLRLLTTTRNHAAPPRQQTLRAALQWSHGFLDARERAVFRRLGVMAGSASLELIQQAVADAENDPGLDEWAILDALGLLVDRSLVTVLADEADDDAPRYRLLDSTRAFALEELKASGELEAVQRRHALAMASLFDAAYDECFSGRIGVQKWMRRLGADFDNARDALTWARHARDASTELAIAGTLLRALPASLHAERMALAESCGTRIGPPVPERLQQRAWIELSVAWADTQKKRSRDAAQRSLDLARSLDHRHDRFTLYFALSRAASAAAQDGDVEAAIAPLTELQALEDPGWPAQRLLWGAEAAEVVARFRGDSADALRRMRRLLALERARGGNASISLGNLIDHELAAGNAAAAAAAGTDLVAALEGSRDEYSLAFARLNLCAAWLAQDEVAKARSVAQAAWPQATAFDLQPYCAAYLALLAALEMRPRTAARLLGYAEAIYAAREETRETNEAAAMARAQSLVRAALGDNAFAAMHAEGAKLRDAEIAALAFEHGHD